MYLVFLITVFDCLELHSCRGFVLLKRLCLNLYWQDRFGIWKEGLRVGKLCCWRLGFRSKVRKFIVGKSSCLRRRQVRLFGVGLVLVQGIFGGPFIMGFWRVWKEYKVFRRKLSGID